MSSVNKHKPGSIAEMISVALPMVVSFACDTVMIFTDRLFLSKLTPQSMSAAMTGGLSVLVLMSFFLGLIGYSTALVAQYYGAGQKEGCVRVFTQTVILSLIAYPLSLSMIPVAHWVFTFSGIDSSELREQIKYFDILIYGSIFTLLRQSLSSYFAGIGRTRVVMLGALVAMAVNVLLNYILVFGKWGVPSLGIEGAALGTIIAAACGVLTLLLFYLSPSNMKNFMPLQNWKYQHDVMTKLWHYGYPNGIEMLNNLLVFTMMVFVFHSEGLMAAAATTIVFNWELVAYVPLVGIEIGVTSLVGRYMGAQQIHLIRKVVSSGLKLGALYAVLMIIIFVIFPDRMVDVFKPHVYQDVFNQALPLAVRMIRFVAFYMACLVMFMVFLGVLRGAGDTLWAMNISVGIHWILLGVLWLMLKVLHCSVYHSWLSVVVVFIIFSGIPYWRYRIGRWRSIHVIESLK